MKIELNTEQYRKLIELMYLADWVLNAARTHDRVTDYNQLEQHLYSYAETFGLSDLVKKEGDEYYTTLQFEESLMAYIEEYDEYTFWENLSLRLAERDLHNEIGPVAKLTENHRKRMYSMEEAYSEEFEKNGLKNLVLQKTQHKK